MRIEKIVVSHQCDFCEEESHNMCVVCGNDVCMLHSAVMCIHLNPFHGGRICWGHLTEDVKEFIKRHQH